MYQLCAVLEHQGDDYNSGHYVSYVLRNGYFYLMNDAADPVRLTFDNLQTKDPYMLFYERVDGVAASSGPNTIQNVKLKAEELRRGKLNLQPTKSQAPQPCRPAALTSQIDPNNIRVLDNGRKVFTFNTENSPYKNRPRDNRIEQTTAKAPTTGARVPGMGSVRPLTSPVIMSGTPNAATAQSSSTNVGITAPERGPSVPSSAPVPNPKNAALQDVNEGLSDKEKRAVGLFLGGAVGDALGAPYETMRTDQISLTDSYKNFRNSDITNIKFNVPAGRWTDDTAQALCLAASLLQKKGHDSMTEYRNYVAYAKVNYMASADRSFGFGRSWYDKDGKLGGKISEFKTAHAQNQTNKYSSSSPNNPNNANGPVMRISPVPLYYHDKPDELKRVAFWTARVTHDQSAAIGTCVFAQILGALLNGEGKDAVLKKDKIQGYFKESLKQTDPLLSENQPDGHLLNMIRNWDQLSAAPADQRNDNSTNRNDTFLTSGAIQTALWAFRTTTNYMDCIRTAIRHGGDTDTVAAMAGMLAGAAYGVDGIPTHLLEGLYAAAGLKQVALELVRQKGQTEVYDQQYGLKDFYPKDFGPTSERNETGIETGCFKDFKPSSIPAKLRNGLTSKIVGPCY